MNNQQKSRLIAEKVMGMDIDGRRFERYAPAANADQAIQALEAFNPSDVRMWRTAFCKDWNVLIIVYGDYKERYHATNKELSAAIVDALVQAVEAE